MCGGHADFAIATNGLPAPFANQVVSLTLAVIAASILLHGVTVTPLMARWGENTAPARGVPQWSATCAALTGCARKIVRSLSGGRRATFVAPCQTHLRQHGSKSWLTTERIKKRRDSDARQRVVRIMERRLEVTQRGIRLLQTRTYLINPNGRP